MRSATARSIEGTTPWCAATSVREKSWIYPTVSTPADWAGDVSMTAVDIARRRGVEDLGSFFRPTLAATMPDPSRIPGMESAVTSFCDAILGGTPMAVYGDYDVDGATSVALVVRYLAELGVDCQFYIPDRLKEGYGVTKLGLDRLADRGVRYVLVVDSGTNAVEERAYAASRSMEMIVLDHHEPGAAPVPGAVNPKCSPQSRAWDYLCSAGLVFLFLVGANRELEQRGWFADGAAIKPDLRRFLGLVALGTVADVVPLIGLNRAYVATGFGRMTDLTGMRALIEATDEHAFSVRSLGFVFGPCINAAGRIDDTSLGARLLITEDVDEAAQLAERLVEINRERQNLQQLAATAAVRAGLEGKVNALPVVVMDDPEWHPGIVGLTASRLRETFDRPAIVIGAGGKGSCRSVEGFDIGAAILAAKEAGILVAGGGHPMAAGFTVEESRIQELADFVGLRATDLVRPPAQVDLVVEVGQLTPALSGELEPLAPFGSGNSQPRIAVVGGLVSSVRELSGRHLKVILRGPGGETEAMLFDGVGTPFGESLRAAEGKRADLLGTVRIDKYGGVERAVLRPEDAMVSGVG
jgi:single-stranded-DNA-specific exonuclease